MDNNQQAQIEQVFTDVLETIAFMFGDAVAPGELDPGAEPCLCASMQFMGPSKGSISIAAPGGICPELASNIMGLDMDDEVSEEQGQDALKELLNVACGQLLTNLDGDQVVYDLTIPEIEALDAEGWQAFAARPGVLGFSVDEYPVMLQFIRE